MAPSLIRGGYLLVDYRESIFYFGNPNVVRIMVEGPPLSQWDSSRAIQLWWQDKQRRTVSDVRKAPKKKKDRDENNDGSTPCTSETFLNLEDWENLVADNDSTDIYDEDTDSSLSMEPD